MRKNLSGLPAYAAVAVIVVMLAVAALAPSVLAEPEVCCAGTVGNVDCSADGSVDIGDVTALIDNLYMNFTPLCCAGEANCDGSVDGAIDIGDITALITHLYIYFDPLPACGGGGGMTFAQRSKVFNAVDSAYQSLEGLPLDTVAARLAAFLNTLPEIDTAGVEDSVSVWANFTDGRIIVIPNNRFPSAEPSPGGEYSELVPDSTVSPNFVQPKRRFASLAEMMRVRDEITAAGLPSAPTYEIPKSRDAFLFNNLQPCYVTISDQIEDLLGAGGYSVTKQAGTVEQLLAVQNAGVFYIDAHGGKGRVFDTTGLPSLGCIWTGTLISAAGDSAYSSMIDAEELVYMYAKGSKAGGCAHHWRYAFTGKFVGQYMTFADNAYVYMGACLSAGGPNYTGFFIGDGFKTAGASVYVGWSKTVTDPPANKGGEYLIDRMLGTNSSTLTPVESPKQRPFDITQLWQDMKNRGFDTDPTNQSKLIVTRLQDGFELLTPSLRYLFEIGNTDSLCLTGYFGTDPGPQWRHVKINDIEQQVYGWEPTLVYVKLPKTGPGSVGPVEVEVDGEADLTPLNDRLSNVVNLTEWLGKVTYTHKDSSSLLGKIEYNVHLRADIHSFREGPHIAPHYYSTIFPGMADISGTGSASGTHSWTDFTIEPPVTTTYTWYGSAPVVPFGDSIPFYLQGYVDAPAKVMKMQLYGAVVEALYQVTEWTPDGIDTSSISFDPPVELYDSTFFPFPFNIPINMGTSWELLAGSREIKTCCSVNGSGFDTEIEHKFAWPTIVPNWAPDSTAAQ